MEDNINPSGNSDDVTPHAPEVIAGWRLSLHAQQVFLSRGFSEDQVAPALWTPDVCRTAFDYGNDRWVYSCGDLSAVVVPGKRTVITLLLRRVEPWDDDDARHINGAA